MVTVSPEDLQYLKDEYKEAVKLILEYQHSDPTLATHQKGVKRGLEIALVRMGVLNDELDEICRRAYRIVEQEQESQDCGGDY